MTGSKILNNNWRLARDPENQGRAEKWFEAVPPGAQPAPVPGIVQQVFPTHQGVAWYWHTFSPSHMPGKDERCLLRFGAVEYLAEVWLNGLPAGGHEGAETPFELDVTELIRPGENLLAVRVVKPGNERVDGLVLAEIPHRNQNDTAHFQPGQSYNIAGITGRVELLIVPAVRIADIFARPDSATGRIEVSITLQNDTDSPVQGNLTLLAGPAGPADGGHILETTGADVTVPPGCSLHELAVTIAQPRLWDLDDPFLYRLTARLDGHELSVRCGFRDFRVKDGFFFLNGRRIFLRSSHTGNHFPVGQITPVDPDHLRRDLIMAKASGFNCIRWIAGVALPEQMDFCDELGLMVYEECYAGWAFYDAPNLVERYERSYREMILRDRNHPSVTIWGLMNEMPDGPAFRCAVDFLPKLRELDPTRLVLLHSGRWDAAPKIGSVSNPDSLAWEPAWGVEGPDAPTVDNRLGWEPGGYLDRAGDAHFYPPFPMPERYRRQLRTLGTDGDKPIFLSECGIGSQHNAIEELRGFDRLDVPEDLPDRNFIRHMAERFTADWTRFGMDGVYPFPVDFFRDSYRLHSRQRRLVFDMIRSNPRFCGYNLTGLLDHALTGEGLWSFWRRWKPGIAEVLEDGWSPLRWCLFVSPAHGYAGEPLKVEAVLANEGALRPGSYPVTFRIWSGDGGVVWEKRVTMEVPVNGDLALPVLDERLQLDMPAGEYVLAADLERGGAPTGDRLDFKISDAATFPHGRGKLLTWGLDEKACDFLTEHGFTCETYAPKRQKNTTSPRTILVGDVPAAPGNKETWDALRSEIEAGAQVIALSANPFRTDFPQPEDASQSKPEKHPWHDLLQSRNFHDWLYHRECVGKRHPLFAGLQSGGILDWEYWGEVVGHAWFAMPRNPCDIIAAGFAVGYSCPGGYDSGLLIGLQRLGQGTLLFNALPLLEHLGRHPAADRLLLNMLAPDMSRSGRPA